ncbi:MAG TPA: NlpC/P60 family protein [Candidatus Aminicenantes bacterium]|nr:NlpC/P60 family protein [Candidatus Aminicenantes bacterium]
METCRVRSCAGLLALVLIGLAGCRAGVQTVPALDPPGRPATKAAAPAKAPSGVVEEPPAEASSPVSAAAARLGYSVQAGAFAVEANARKLAASLTSLNLDAFYFPAGAGLFKVRFGDFPSKAAADRAARRLVAEGRIESYFVVAPGERAAAVHARPALGPGLRDGLVAAAESFVGSGYAWGGTTARGGFDCSGLVRAVYRLNGLDLPRSVADQYRAGSPVRRDLLAKGDLVFFSSTPGRERTHVGVYAGGGEFIHAPGAGKTVRRDSLESRYFRDNFRGGRTYLGELSARN